MYPNFLGYNVVLVEWDNKMPARLFLTAILLLLFGCGDLVPLNLSKAQEQLDKLELDEAFFKTYARVVDASKTNPEAAMLAARAGLRALAKTKAESLENAFSSQKTADFAGKIFETLSPDSAEAQTVYALHAMSSGILADLEPALSPQSEALADSVRILAIVRLLEVLDTTIDLPETSQADTALKMLPGFPVPYSMDFRQTAYPQIIKTLSNLLSLPVKDPALSGSLSNLKQIAEKMLGNRYIPNLVAMQLPREIPQPWGVKTGRQPVTTLAINQEALYLGIRPVLTWKDQKTAFYLDDYSFPGKAIADLEELNQASPDSLSKAIQAVRDLSLQTLPIEQSLVDAKAPRILIFVSQGLTAAQLRTIMFIALEAGVEDLNFAISSVPGAFFPVFGKEVEHSDITVHLSAVGCRVTVQERTEITEAFKKVPEHVKLSTTSGKSDDKEYFVQFEMPWNQNTGFNNGIVRALAALGQDAKLSRVVKVVLDKAELPAQLVYDAAFEIVGFPGKHFPDVEIRFPGVRCPGVSPCVGGIPVLFVK